MVSKAVSEVASTEDIPEELLRPSRDSIILDEYIQEKLAEKAGEKAAASFIWSKDLGDIPKPVFLDYPRFLAGALNMVVGIGDVGKTALLAELSRKWVKGRGFLDKPIEKKQRILWVIGENFYNTARRLQGIDNLALIDAREQKITLGQDNDVIQAAIEAGKFDVVIFDALNSLSGDRNLNSRESVDEVLGDMETMARDKGTTFILIHHAGKRNDGKAENAIMGSVHIRNMMRSVLLLGKPHLEEGDEGTQDGKMVSVVHQKHNESAPAKPVRFILKAKESEDEDAWSEMEFIWKGTSRDTADDLVTRKQRRFMAEDSLPAGPKAQEARDAILKMIADGTTDALKVRSKLNLMGHSVGSIMRGRDLAEKSGELVVRDSGDKILWVSGDSEVPF